MLRNTALSAITLAAGFLFAGVSGVPAAGPPAAVAKQAHTEKIQTSPSKNSCPAWWLTTYKPYKTQKGKTGPTPERMKKRPMHKPPKPVAVVVPTLSLG